MWELTYGILDQLAKFERAKIAKRTHRGKLRKAREGKLLKNGRAHYGFRHDESGESYVVYEEEMRVVRRIFRAMACGESLHGVKRMLERAGVPPPGNGRKGDRQSYWSAPFIREVIREDAYYPHTREEVAALVSPEVAARLVEGVTYSVFWFNRTRTTRKRVSTSGPGGQEYRWRHTVKKNPRPVDSDPHP